MSSEGDHRGGFGFRGDVTEAILARDLSVSAAWCGEMNQMLTLVMAIK